MKNYKLTANDKKILSNYVSLVHGVALVCGPSCEVSLHSIENLDHSILEIVNGNITGRDIGDAMIPLVRERILDYLSGEHEDNKHDIIGIFYTYNQLGHPLKSVAIVIRNPKDVIIGCIGIHMDVGIPLYEFTKALLPSVNGGMMDEFSEHTPKDVDQLVFSSLAEAINVANSIPRLTSVERNRIIVKDLNSRGIFNIRGAVEMIAKELGTSRYTIYNYLKDTKSE